MDRKRPRSTDDDDNPISSTSSSSSSLSTPAGIASSSLQPTDARNDDDKRSRPDSLRHSSTALITYPSSSTTNPTPSSNPVLNNIYQLTTLTNRTLHQTVRRSSLAASNFQLDGHDGGITSLEFNSTGDLLASASKDKTIFLWKASGTCENIGVLKGHTNAVLDIHWLSTSPSSSSSSTLSSSSSSLPTDPSSLLLSASADKTCILWDTFTQKKVRKFTGHTGIINAASPFRYPYRTFISGSDDRTVRLWDLRQRSSVQQFTEPYPVLTIVASQHNEDNYTFFTGGIDGMIKQYDIRKNSIVLTYSGHTDSVTHLTLSPFDPYELSSIGNDNCIKVWNTKPFVAGSTNPYHQSRLIHTYTGISNNFEMNLLKGGYNRSSTLFSSGSSDRSVYVFSTENRSLLYRLGGHNGVVTCTAFHPYENILASGSTDKTICIGVLNEEEEEEREEKEERNGRNGEQEEEEEENEDTTQLPEGVTIGDDF